MTIAESPLVTVVIPVYNRDYSISRALESVFSQTFQELEIIVVDDGSTDQLDRILKKQSDERLKVIRLKTNKGAATARNEGIKRASGKLVAFLDSDDEWLPDKLEKQVRQYDALKKLNKKIGGSFTGYYLHKKKGLPERRLFRSVSHWKPYFLDGCLISPGSTLLVEKAVYTEIGLYDDSLERFEDWEWLLRFSRKFELAIYPESLTRVYQGSLPPRLLVSSCLAKLLRSQRTSLSLWERMRLSGACHLELGYSYLSENFLKASAHFSIAILLNPCLIKRMKKGSF